VTEPDDPMVQRSYDPLRPWAEVDVEPDPEPLGRVEWPDGWQPFGVVAAEADD